MVRQPEAVEKLCKAFDEAGIPAGPVMNHVEVFNDPQTIAREMVVEVEHTKIGKMKTIGAVSYTHLTLPTILLV